MNAPQTPYERFMAHLPAYAAQRDNGPSWPLYERLKANFERSCINITPQQYEAAMRAIAKACGV